MENGIREINVHIKDALEQWATIALKSDADGWAFMLNYDEEDLWNATYIFQHVISNIGIKTGRIDESNAASFGERLHDLILEESGIDTRSLSRNEGRAD